MRRGLRYEGLRSWGGHVFVPRSDGWVCVRCRTDATVLLSLEHGCCVADRVWVWARSKFPPSPVS